MVELAVWRITGHLTAFRLVSVTANCVIVIQVRCAVMAVLSLRAEPADGPVTAPKKTKWDLVSLLAALWVPRVTGSNRGEPGSRILYRKLADAWSKIWCQFMHASFLHRIELRYRKTCARKHGTRSTNLHKFLVQDSWARVTPIYMEPCLQVQGKAPDKRLGHLLLVAPKCIVKGRYWLYWNPYSSQLIEML